MKYLFTSLFLLTIATFGVSQKKPISSIAAKEKLAVDVELDKAQQLLTTNKELVVLDVRTKGEFQQGHLPNAINIDYNAADFASRIDDLDRNKPYLIYCHAGVRSKAAFQMMQQKGFIQLYNMKGGWAEWSKKGQKTK